MATIQQCLSDKSDIMFQEFQKNLNHKDLISLRSREITNRPLDEIKDSTKKNWKYINMLLPSILIISFGFWRFRKEKFKAEMLKQIYD